MLSCKNISVKYNSMYAVKDVSFELNERDYMCIVGENGSGKSTLMKCMLGFLKPIDGEITYGVKTRIGYMPQQAVFQKDFPASVMEVVLSGRLNRHKFSPFFTKQDKYAAILNLKKLGAEQLINKSYTELSGGQRQRVLLARALTAGEKLLMLDEPVSGLDPVVAAEMYALLKKLNTEEGLTIVMISHDIESAIKYGNKILQMQTSPVYYGGAKEYATTALGSKLLEGMANA